MYYVYGELYRKIATISKNTITFFLRFIDPFITPPSHTIDIAKRKEAIDMGLLMTIVLGLIVGAVASWLTATPNGFLMDIVLGIVGALAGSFIMNLFGFSGVNGFNIYSMLVALLGSIIIIYLGRFLTRHPKITA